MTDDVLSAVQDLGNLATELDLPLAQLALAWVLSRRNVTGLVVGGSRPGQVRENVQAVSVALPADALTRIDTMLSGLGAPART
jgi:aryl-alcohol dehydrogenase-like predicted oxidoreductase